MVYNWVAPACDLGRTFHRKRSVFEFPKDPARLQLWSKQRRCSNFIPSKFSRICEIHFEPRYIERTTFAIYPDERKMEASLKKPRLAIECDSDYLSIQLRRYKFEGKMNLLAELPIPLHYQRKCWYFSAQIYCSNLAKIFASVKQLMQRVLNVAANTKLNGFQRKKNDEIAKTKRPGGLSLGDQRKLKKFKS